MLTLDYTSAATSGPAARIKLGTNIALAALGGAVVVGRVVEVTTLVVVGTPFVPVRTVMPVLVTVGAKDAVPDELLPPVARLGNRLDPHRWGRLFAYVAMSRCRSESSSS